MSLRRKFYVAFSLIACLAIGLAAYGVRALSATSDLVVELYDEPLMAVSYARAASAKLNEAHGLMDRSLALGPGESPDAADRLASAEAEIAQDLMIVRRRVRERRVARALDRARDDINDWFGSGRAILAPPTGGVTALPMPDVVERQGAAAAAALDDLVELVTARGFDYRTRAAAQLRASSLTLAALCAGIIALSALFALLFAHLLIRPIRAATRIAEDVAAGRVTTVAGSRRRDEIGRLLTCLATMQANLRDRAAQALSLLRDKDRAAEALRQTNLRFDTALNNMTHGLLMCDAEERVVVANHRLCDIYGIPHESIGPALPYRELLALSLALGNHPGKTLEDVLAVQAPMLQSRERTTAEQTIAGGKVVAISFEPMPDGGWIATHEDVTERRRVEQQIAFLAQHDALTRLPNRVLFQERLELALALAGRGQGFALLCLDLDRFKAVNDTLGHPIGDALLRAVAARLLGVVRASDTVARMGGDEFSILQLGVAEPADATGLAARLIREVGEPYELGGHRMVIGVSVGIAMAPADGALSELLLKNADLALYRAKQDGRGTARFFDPTMDVVARDRHVLEHDLRSALAAGQLELHYQPLVSGGARIATGLEALLRWRHPERGMVGPADFVAVAEDTGMIVPIGAWVLQQACAEAASWPPHLKVAVNVSPLQFRNGTLVKVVTDALRQSGLAPARLVLEINESALWQNDRATLSVLHALRALGVRVALDDFGTGYSSLSYLRSFPFDAIKIDRSFVGDVQSGGECLAIVRAICGLGSSLNISITAEGVETEAQFDIMAAEGCAEMQGYLFSAPVAAEAVPALIARLTGSQQAPLLAIVARR